jgi:type IV fimbrial biogenesis protein FimT
MKLNNHKQTGFTIFELLITVTVVAIVMMIAAPTFSFAVANSRIKTAASDFHADMMLARSEAIKRRVTVDIIKLNPGWFMRLNTTPTFNLKTITGLGSDITQVCNIDADAAPEVCPPLGVQYDRNGRASIPTYEMRFYSDSNTDVAMRCVKLSLSGRPSVLMDTDGNIADGCD